MLAVLLFPAVPPVQAQTTPTLYFTNCTVTSGGSAAYCYLRMSEAENISAMDYMIVYDADNLELTQVNNAGFTAQSDVTVSVNSAEPGIIHVTLVSGNGLNGSGYLNLMYFRAKQSAPAGTYPITVLVNDVYDASLETVAVSQQAGTITVREAAPAVKSVSFYNSVSASSLTAGENVDFRLSANNPNGLSAGTFAFSYDETKLKLTDVTMSSAMEGTVYDVNTTRPGLVKVAFASETAITSGSNLVILHFSAIAAGQTTVSCTPSDLYDSQFYPMSGSTSSRSLSILEPEIVIDYPDLRIEVPAEMYSDKAFSVQILLEGNSGVRAGDFTFTYNKNVLECLSVTGGTVSGAWVVTDKNYSDGQVRFSLMSNTDLTEDVVLVTMQMHAVKNADSTSDVSLSGSNVSSADFTEILLEYGKTKMEITRPAYTVRFFDSDGTTLLSTGTVMSGNSAIPPIPAAIKKQDGNNHLVFSSWNTPYSIITENTDIIAVYTPESHTASPLPAVAPTCTETGLTEGSFCPVCDTVLKPQEVIPANGHTPVTQKAVAPTCTETGLTEGSYCSVCNVTLVRQEVIPASGHTTVTQIAVAPTCTEPGLTEGSSCSACNMVFVKQEVIPANGHTPVTQKAVAPTCTETGLTEGSYCSVCNVTLVKQEVIPASGHTEIPIPDVEPDYGVPGAQGGTTCSVCGEVVKQPTTLPPLIPEDGVLLDRRALSLTVGESAWVTATVYPLNAADKTVVWTISDETVVSLSERRLYEGDAVVSVDVKGQQSGSTILSVPFDWDNAPAFSGPAGGASASYRYDAGAKTLTLYVTYQYDKWIGDFAITDSSGNLITNHDFLKYGSTSAARGTLWREGDTETITINITDVTVPKDLVIWVSSVGTSYHKQAKLTIDLPDFTPNVQITALKSGMATVTATNANGNFSDSLTVTVPGITLDQTSLSLKVGESASVTASVIPADAPDKTVVWTSSDDTVAAVINGVITALKPGTATVTAATADGNYSDTVAVTVKQPVIGIVLDTDSLSLKVGESASVIASVIPDDASDKTVVWTSSDDTVAAVINGVITALKPGTATVTAATADGAKSAACTVSVAKRTVTPTVTVPESVILTPQGNSWLAGENMFFVTSRNAYTLLVSHDGGKTFTELIPASTADGKDSFLIENVTSATVITVVIKGDINKDGTFDYFDVSKLYAFYRRKATIDDSVITDINGDGTFNYYDVSKLYAIFRCKTTFT